jgi:hypothetical protein
VHNNPSSAYLGRTLGSILHVLFLGPRVSQRAPHNRLENVDRNTSHHLNPASLRKSVSPPLALCTQVPNDACYRALLKALVRIRGHWSRSTSKPLNERALRSSRPESSVQNDKWSRSSQLFLHRDRSTYARHPEFSKPHPPLQHYPRHKSRAYSS